MQVKRIVPNVEATAMQEVGSFYEEVLGLEVLMDLGWIRTYGPNSRAASQVSLMSEGGSGTPVPDISIEVDALDDVLARVKKAGAPVVYGPATEPWGVRRFFVRDPTGKLINILQHG